MLVQQLLQALAGCVGSQSHMKPAGMTGRMVHSQLWIIMILPKKRQHLLQQAVWVAVGEGIAGLHHPLRALSMLGGHIASVAQVADGPAKVLHYIGLWDRRGRHLRLQDRSKIRRCALQVDKLLTNREIFMGG